MLLQIEQRVKSSVARRLAFTSPSEALFTYALSRSVQDRTTEKPAFNFDFFVGGFDGLSFAAPGQMGGSSFHRILSSDGASRAVKASKTAARMEMFLRHALASGGALIDIGANVGLTSIPHAILGDFHPVIAVEPELRNFMCLEANARANGAEMICHHAAAAASPGTGVLKLKSNPTHHYLAAKGKGERVALLTVDLLAQAADRVSLVKVDVQGGEADVLRGAGDLLRRREAAWLVEVRAPKHAGAADTAFIAATVETHFDGFMDTRAAMPEIRAAHLFPDYLNTLSRKFTDFVFVP